MSGELIVGLSDDLDEGPELLPMILSHALGEGTTEINQAEHERRTAYALGLGFDPVGVLADQYLGQQVMIVGSGPSYDAAHVRAAKRAGVMICAVNMQHDQLIRDGVTPDFSVMLDPGERVAGYQTPTDGVKYFIGSSVHHKVWAKFREAGVDPYLFIPTMDSEQHNRLIARYDVAPMSLVCGPTTVGLRTINILAMLGFWEPELHAFDSCYAPGRNGLDGGGLYSVKKPLIRNDGRVLTIRSKTTGDMFTCISNGAMARQLLGFQSTVTSLRDLLPNRPISEGVSDEELKRRIGKIRLKVSGDGAIPWMAWKDGGPNMEIEHVQPEKMQAKYGDCKHFDYYTGAAFVHGTDYTGRDRASGARAA